MEDQEKGVIITNLRSIYSKYKGESPEETSEITPKIMERVNYKYGVPMKYLTNDQVKNFRDLVEITLEYKTDPTPFEIEVNNEVRQILGVNPLITKELSYQL